MATCQTIIERALLRAGDTDALGRTKVEMLSDLNHLVRDVYEDIITWKVFGVPGFEVSSTTVSLSSGIGSKPSDLKATAEVWYDDNIRLNYAPIALWKTLTDSYVWTDYSSTQYGIKPDDLSEVTVYYYPTLSDLSLTDTFPGGGQLDNLAELYLMLQIIKADRDNDLDFKAALTDFAVEHKRVRQMLYTREARHRTVSVPRWPIGVY